MLARAVTIVVCFCLTLGAFAAPEDFEVRVRSLIADLSSVDYQIRSEAYRALDLIGEDALPWLEEAAGGDDPEVSRLVSRLLSAIRRRGSDDLLSALSVSWQEFPGSDEMAMLVAEGRKIIPGLYRVIDQESSTGRPSYDRLRNAYTVLGSLSTEEDLPELLRRLRSPNTNNRFFVRQILETLDVEIVSAEVFKRIESVETNEQVRAHLLEIAMISNFARNEERFAAVAERDLADKSAIVRQAALRFLAFRRREGALPKILARCRDEDGRVRTEAFRALRSYSAPEAFAALRAGLVDPEPKARAAACDTLGGSDRADVAPMIRPLLRDGDTFVRSSAARVLARFGDEAALPTLISLLDERGEEFLTYTLVSVVDAVGNLGNRAALAPLLRLLDDTDEYDRISNYRYAILRAAVKTGGVTVLPLVRLALTDKSIQNRYLVLDAVIGLESEEVLPILTAALESGDSRMRTSAVQGLSRLNHSEAAPTVAKLLAEEDPWLLTQAVKALTQFRYARCVPELLKLLELDATDNRYNSLFYAVLPALVIFDAKEAAKRVAEIAATQPNQRYLAVDTLGRLGDRSVVPALKALLTEEGLHPSLVRRIHYALARLGETGPLVAWLETEEASNVNLRIEALMALGRLDEAEKLLRDQIEGNAAFANCHYDLACVLALKGDSDRALFVLGHAVTLRSFRREIVLADPDLRSLFEDERFEAILEKCR